MMMGASSPQNRTIRAFAVLWVTSALVVQGFSTPSVRSSKCRGTTPHYYYMDRLSSMSTTRLYEGPPQKSGVSKQEQQQKKPPRFSQKAHATKNPSRKSTNSAASSEHTTPQVGTPSRRGGPRQAWESNQSIEDLEQRMTQRWGTLDGSQASPASQRNNSNDKKRGKNLPAHQKNNGNAAGLHRPVFDPWAQDEAPDGTGSRNAPPPTIVREFYDEDDEGYEYLELDEDDDDLDEYELEDEDGTLIPRDSKVKISHLIAPKPAGGRGTNEGYDDDINTGSYFFNPNKKPRVQEEPPSKKDKKTKTPSLNTVEEDSNDASGATSKSKKRRGAPEPATQLLDEDSNPIFMTVDEALHRFQASLMDNKEGAVEILEDPEALPIVVYSQAQSWDEVGITSPSLRENLRKMSCQTPLSVQEKAIPAILTGNDVLIGTYTGSGKTLAFFTPLVQQLLWNLENDDADVTVSDPGLAVLVVAPGRELASQIVSVARRLLEGTSLTVQLAIGGTTFSRNLDQIRKRKPNIIVGTPGRIAELVVGKPGEKSGRLKIGSLQALVLDEFDALLEYKPHRDPTRAILQSLKRRHRDSLQSILCSATASDIMDSAKVMDYLRPGFATAMADDDDVLVTDKSTTKKPRPQVSRTVMHGVVHVPHRRFALDTVRRILHTEPIPQQILIFVDTARKVDIMVEKLAERGIIAAPLHGGQGSEKMDRAEVSKALREGYVGIVVATEMAARGLDAPFLTHVINLDLPTDASHYAHRAGRCGRGGRPGVVINMTTSPRERNVPLRFADSLGIEMHTVEARQGKLVLVDPETQKNDQ